MKTVALAIYEFSELSDEAKARAKADYFAIAGYAWADDALASLEGFAAHFGAAVKDYSIDWSDSSYSSAKFSDVDLDADELEAKVEALHHDGTCQFTGYCADDDCNEGAVRAYSAGERDAGEILQAGFRAWLKACQDDANAMETDEAFTEHADANGYRFYADGRFYA